MRDETLAWLAVHDQLRRRSKRTFSGIVMSIFGGRGRAAARDAVTSLRVRTTSRPGMEPPPTNYEQLIPRPVSAHMVRYSLAVDELAKKLTEAERFTLRATGEVPDWFVPEVYRCAKKM
jgi:hypothetical protein